LAATSSDSPLGYLLNKVGNSRIVKRGDAKSFSNEILYLKEHPIVLSDREYARDQIVANYSKKVVCEKYISLIESLEL
jgi:glycosyltransferase involved in cell wall biosynthesis